MDAVFETEHSGGSLKASQGTGNGRETISPCCCVWSSHEKSIRGHFKAPSVSGLIDPAIGPCSFRCGWWSRHTQRDGGRHLWEDPTERAPLQRGPRHLRQPGGAVHPRPEDCECSSVPCHSQLGVLMWAVIYHLAAVCALYYLPSL